MLRQPIRRAMIGAAAGAAGTTALNAVTYLDMVWRGRPASSTPEDTVQKLSSLTHVEVPGDEKTRSNRLQGLGPLLGLVTGTVVGAGYGLLVSATGKPTVGWAVVGTCVAAMAAGNAPMTGLGITDPRSWSTAEWASDVAPHIAYGVVAALTFEAADRTGAA